MKRGLFDSYKDETRTSYNLKVTFFIIGCVATPLFLIYLVYAAMINNNLIYAIAELLPVTPFEVLWKVIAYAGIYIFIKTLIIYFRK